MEGGRKEWRKKGRKEQREEGMEGGRKEGMEGGREEGTEGGRKEGRKEWREGGTEGGREEWRDAENGTREGQNRGAWRLKMGRAEAENRAHGGKNGRQMGGKNGRQLGAGGWAGLQQYSLHKTHRNFHPLLGDKQLSVNFVQQASKPVYGFNQKIEEEEDGKKKSYKIPEHLQPPCSQISIHS
ncbi:Octapeptide-repeat protein T2, partial [Ophiophagus hannah]